MKASELFGTMNLNPQRKDVAYLVESDKGGDCDECKESLGNLIVVQSEDIKKYYHIRCWIKKENRYEWSMPTSLLDGRKIKNEKERIEIEQKPGTRPQRRNKTCH